MKVATIQSASSRIMIDATKIKISMVLVHNLKIIDNDL